MQLREEHQTSLVRGIGAACITGAVGFLYQWTETEELKQLVASGAIPFLTTLGGFLGFGAYDARRNDGRPLPAPRVRRRRREEAAA